MVATPPPADTGMLDHAVEIVRAAGALTMRWFRADDLAIDRKGDGTPVTEADKGAERFLREQLAVRYPNDTVIGEEEADNPGTSTRTWIIDPIDGTKAFTHGVPLFTNLLAMNDEHGPAIGVINLPALGETIYAGRGLGCFDNGTPAHVSAVGSLAAAHLSTSSFSHWPDPLLLAVKAAGPSLRTWGDGYGYALVATGRIEAMVDPEVSLWDVAPMPVIMAEAGGRYTDFAGAVDPSTGCGFATNGLVHEELQRLLGPYQTVS